MISTCAARFMAPARARLLLFPLLLLVVAGCAAPQRVSLGDLPLVTSIQQGWGRVQVDRSVEERPLTIAGRTFQRGVGTHAHSVLHLALDGCVERFTAHVGVDDETAGKGSVRFKVYSDQRRLFDSGVISGGQPSPHPIQGIGAGFIPKNLDTSLLDGVIQVEAEPAREYARRSAREEGLLVGISSGATLAAIAQKLPELPAGSRVLGFNYDTGERYLSVEGFLPA